MPGTHFMDMHPVQISPRLFDADGLVFGAPLYDDGLINSRRDYTYAEPTVEYNAGAVGAAAALADWYSTQAYTGVDSLDGVMPFACDVIAPAPAPALAPVPAPAQAPALAPLEAPPPSTIVIEQSSPVPQEIPSESGGAVEGTPSAVPPISQADRVAPLLSAVLAIGMGIFLEL